METRQSTSTAVFHACIASFMQYSPYVTHALIKLQASAIRHARETQDAKLAAQQGTEAAHRAESESRELSSLCENLQRRLTACESETAELSAALNDERYKTKHVTDPRHSFEPFSHCY